MMEADAVACIPLPTRQKTRHLARALAPLLKASDLLILDGQLGSGKTFFVRALARALGLPERIRVTSPTFSLVHEIATRPPIVHADLYRLSSTREVAELALDEQREAGAVVIVEWGLPYVETLGGDGLILEFRHEPRRVHARATGARSSITLRALEAQRLG
ncbi:MAG TPA: tRNA (adenosine(37)-N6)-threonylcarbamoyltransferase complex ATPase subunit type 1 TsaE [Polyangiaceae bacterium]|nr:tRNA (adenosine(37)-N6)-threonylcarbamoyltransferase complex ATPase subunit type 1 TsaE [Polyangiaceae bacterium]